MSKHFGKQAIVIGAGMGGLAAAKALAGRFEQVLLLDRDELPPAAVHRPGAPQSRHAHVLMSGGTRALGELFPGFEASLTRADAVEIDFPFDARIERGGFDPFPQRKLEIMTCCASRPLIEFTTRHLLENQTAARFIQGCRVLEVLASPDGARVIGVRCENADGQKETLAADLVIDASGRGGLTLELLKSLGLPVPEETSIGMDVGYSTARFAIPDDAPKDWKFVGSVPNAPTSSRGGVLSPVEDNQWIVTLYGMHGDKPPGDWDGFMGYAHSLRTPTIYNAVAHAMRMGEIHRFVLPASVRRHFERLKAFPRGFLPLGDAICRFNPVFGQGMTVAALEALHLDRLLSARAGADDPFADLARSYFDGVQDITNAPWSTANLDLAYPETSGVRPPDFENILKFGAGVFRLAARDPAVHKLFTEVQQLLKPSSVYRDPDFVERVKAVMAEA